MQEELITGMRWVEVDRVSCLPTCLRGDANEGCRVSGTFAMRGNGDGLAFSRESDAEVAGDGQGVYRTGRRSKHWR